MHFLQQLAASDNNEVMNHQESGSPTIKDKSSPLSIEKCRSHPSPILLNQHGAGNNKKDYSSTPKVQKTTGASVKFNLEADNVSYFDVNKNLSYQRRNSFNNSKKGHNQNQQNQN